ncbi:ATP/GTP-binding protein [Larkinella knui]
MGKSNILEALGLLGSSYNDNKYLQDTIRYEKLVDLYYDHDISQDISISTDQTQATLSETVISKNSESAFNLNLKDERSLYKFINYHLSEKGQLLGILSDLNRKDSRLSPVRKYDFSGRTKFENLFQDFLLPPDGRNLYAVLNRRDDLIEEFVKLFKSQGLEFVFLEKDQTFGIQKRQGPRVKLYEFFTIADTFRRFMFYITAIESNKDSVIIFEEPEVHSFPPYTLELAYRIIYDEDDQYFISTHSPYLLHTLIENLKDDQLNVFITYYENYETKVKAMTPDELRDVLDFSTDIFFNLDKFLPNAGRTVSA